MAELENLGGGDEEDEGDKLNISEILKCIE